jgi:hypothetical protein
VPGELTGLLHVQHLKARGDVSQLIEMLGDRDPDARAAAARALGDLDAHSATSALVRALDDGSDAVRWAAIHALEDIGAPDAVEPLLARLRSAAYPESFHLAQALGRIGDQRAVGPLIAALEQRKARLAVVEALGELGGDDARVALRALRIPRTRFAVAAARREAVASIERRTATAEDRIRSPLTPVLRDVLALVLVGLATATLLIAFAAVFLKADVVLAVLVAVPAVSVLGLWQHLRAPSRIVTSWVPRARPLRVSTHAESVTRIVFHRIASAGLPTMIAAALVWGASLLMPAEVAVAIAAALTCRVGAIGEAIALHRWQREHDRVLLRERDAGEIDHQRLFSAPSGDT